ncbi:beta-lactamase domain protein (plasmid) [Natrialba magadii ATCC 43099]|uniref:Beta-lactamase n=1 Tax=Natrialba magadii (strain ATCC 43099 / DSM 3394 / CCM 3739 / CIP 104546 / IAM 13178 / JCM 8861 / NBRC 102185 / NCIMB 2190 / MS3) TaxID=547559 RepID=D3T287_NATMM|nr:MBL fold metallo-hydrolase [Natrialba magadii]ADD07696.1 beta-lactamase domain protein [Natrialba magadii ATCC 43099]ELY26506.1 beta-lactamase [Natrialba magadii ATCC 43099]
MRVSYQHANVHSGNESTLLRFTTEDGTRACVLVDAGDNVDVESMLGDDEYLNAILLTHAHIDHYQTLARNVHHSASIYTSPATATVLEQSLPEAQKDNNLGDISVALDALEPIDDWTSILSTLEVRPVAAGHTPGAAGFILRFRDENSSDDPLSGEQHLLVTGDFTTRPCAGYPGLETAYPFDIDCVLLNVSNDDSYTAALNESLETVLERAFAGSRVVVATSSLTGVHYATLLARVATELERELPITLVGQAAKLYTALEYDEPSVTPVEVFERPAEVLEDGGVTITGPESATTGSSRRLLETVGDDPGALFLQLATGNGDGIPNTQCTTQSVRLCNHPTLETIDDVVRSLAPIEVVIKHARGETLNRFQRRFDRCFTWGTNDQDIHRLYEDGRWNAPGWIPDTTASQIRRRHWEAVQEQSLEAPTTLDVNRREPITLEAEGVNLDVLEETFVRTVADPYASTDSDGVTADTETLPAETESLEEQSLEAELLARLDAIDAKLECSEETVRARVLSGGEDEQFLQLLDQAELEAGEVIELSIKSA